MKIIENDIYFENNINNPDIKELQRECSIKILGCFSLILIISIIISLLFFC